MAFRKNHVKTIHSRGRRPHSMSRGKSKALYRGTHKSHPKNTQKANRGGFRL